MKNKLKSFLGLLLIVLLMTTGFPFSLKKAQAAALTQLSDVQTNQTMGQLSSHTIQFVTPSGIPSTTTSTLVFNNATTIAGLTSNDISITVNGTVATSSVGAPTAANWGIAFTASTVTLSSPTGVAGAAASSSILIKIGTAATSTAVNRITNYASATTTLLTITTAGGTDSAVIALPVITNSIVNITATVSPTITFTIDTNALQFGTLNSSLARWATSTAGGSGSDVVGNVLTINTNSTSGFSITLQGSTLTASSGTITPITGSPAVSATSTSQFGLYAVETGGTGATSSVNYRTAGSYFFGATATTTSVLGSGTSPTATATYSIHYIANISPTTPAGAYSTNLTYIATPQF